MTNAAIDEFLAVIDSTQGLYLDMRRGFGAIVHEFDQMRADNLRRFPHRSAADLDKLSLIYEVADPEAGSYSLHECTQAEYRERNSPRGFNPIQAGNMCLTHIYQLWDDCHRSEIAKSLGLAKEALKIDIFGDFRLLRHSIIHHRAVALADVAKCKVIKWFKEGDNIWFTREQFLDLVTHAKQSVNELRSQTKTQQAYMDSFRK